MDFYIVYYIGQKRDGKIQAADSVGRVFRLIKKSYGAVKYFNIVE